MACKLFRQFAELTEFQDSFGKPCFSVAFGDFRVSSFAMGVGERRAAAGLKRTPGKL